MNVVGSTALPQVFHPDGRIRKVSRRVVQDLPYGCILGAACSCVNRSVLSFVEDGAFNPSPDVP